MSWYEINALLKYDYYANKENWEQARLISYIVAQVNSKRKLNFQDIIKFPWEEEAKETSISKEDIERLKEQAKQYINGRNSN